MPVSLPFGGKFLLKDPRKDQDTKIGAITGSLGKRTTNDGKELDLASLKIWSLKDMG